MFSVGSFLGTHMLEAEQGTQFTCLTLVFFTSLAMALINCMTRVFITALTKGNLGWRGWVIKQQRSSSCLTRTQAALLQCL